MPSALPPSSLALRRIPLLDVLSTAQLDALAVQCQWLRLDVQQALPDSRQDQESLYFLVSGHIRIMTHAANGKTVTIADMAPGDHFGEMAAIGGAATAQERVAVEPSLVARLDHGGFLQWLRDEPQLSYRLLCGLTDKTRALYQRVVELSTLDVRSRLLAQLLRLVHSAGVDDNRACIAHAPAHSALASMIGTSREQVTREMSALTRKGLLNKSGHVLCVTDVAALARQFEQHASA
ncbi:transcriptional regulator [Bordetella ansorpii]|uniref:Transcriptional regulator n=1 Tax=Bordetella ansorpii TaxID=288768 RepID=A0A157QWY0_9BORD|nr:Crp/Fnr family transcriptional regulator [Bordetella ansorpii]SAI50136.1 transcriptional regulator [Bordetella ansorpii]